MKQKIIHLYDEKLSNASITLNGEVKLLEVLGFESEAMCCCFSRNCKLLAIGLSDGVVKIFSLESKVVVYSIISPSENNNLPVTSISWKPIFDNAVSDELENYNILVSYASGVIQRFHVTTNEALNQFQLDDIQILTGTYNGAGSQSLYGCANGNIYLVDEENNKLVTTFESSTKSDTMDGHVMRVFSLQYHPQNDNVFVSAGWDDTVQWWDKRVDNKNSIQRISGPHICGEGLHVDPVTLNIVAASWRYVDNLQVFQFDSGKFLNSIHHGYDKTMLYCAKWKDKDTVVCGGSHNNVLRIVNSISSKVTGSVTNLPGAVISVDVCDYSSRSLISLCSSKNVYLVEDTH